ncbi:MAG: hypothetical protein PHD67_07855, partial [Oscillospiraceae bacterium]|nr:hypothetical protein [Oscillospiraceae bacterium]
MMKKEQKRNPDAVSGEEKASKFTLSYLLHNDIFLRVMSVLVACGMWFAVASANKSVKSVEIKGVPVKVDTQSTFLSKMGLTAIGDEDAFV